MIAVIFELQPHNDKAENYFELAHTLKPVLESIDGFLSIERFESMVHPGKYLSLSFWRDEASVEAWRNRAQHRGAQSSGRASIFENYRLRVAHVVRDYGLNERAEAPMDSREVHG